MIMMTPAAALEPYIAAEEAPFKMSILWISSGFNSLMSKSLVIGTLSTTIRGEVAPLKEGTPRISNRAGLPGAPSPAKMLRPGICPCIMWATLVAVDSSIMRESKLATEPVRSFFVVVPYPITTTSSTSLTSSSSTTFNVCWPVHFISFVFIPMNENCSTRESCFSTFIVYSPFTSVDTPIVVPLIKIVTPGRGVPFLSFTLPRMTIISFSVSFTDVSDMENLFSLVTSLFVTCSFISTWCFVGAAFDNKGKQHKNGNTISPHAFCLWGDFVFTDASTLFFLAFVCGFFFILLIVD